MVGRQWSVAILAAAIFGMGMAFTDVPAGAAAPAGAEATKPVAKPTAAKAPPALSPDREKAAIAFAHEHHPELASLIEKLRTDNHRQYDMAIRQLAQASDRLLRLKKQNSAQYELALAAWKLDSRAQLLAARLTMSQDPAIESELKKILRERVDVRLKELEFEREQIENRWNNVDSAIRDIERNKTAVANRDFQRIKNSVARNRRPSAKKTPSSKAPVTTGVAAAKSTPTSTSSPTSTPTSTSTPTPNSTSTPASTSNTTAEAKPSADSSSKTAGNLSAKPTP